MMLAIIGVVTSLKSTVSWSAVIS